MDTQQNLQLSETETRGQYSSTTYSFVIDPQIKKRNQLKDTEQYSSTMAREYQEHCPQALDFIMKGLPRDTRIYQRGNTAHFILENVGKANAVNPEHQKAIAKQTVHKLTTEGYYYYGEKQPAFDFDLAHEGAEVALKWLERNSLPYNAKYENVFAMDAQGNSCHFEDPRCRWRAKIDVFWEKVEVVNEESELRIGATSDYKSAWAAGKDWLQTTQAKSQMVLIWVNHPELDGVCAEVINLRTGSVNSQTIYFDEEGISILSKWREEIFELCDTMDKNREARPGVGCWTCSFVAHCDVAQKVKSEKELVAAYAVLDRERDDLKKIIRVQLEDADGIECNGGFIGYDLKPKTVMRPEHTTQIVAAWWGVPLEDAALMTKETSLVRALGLGASNLDNFMDTLSYENEIERQDFFNLCATKEYRAEFGVHRFNGHKLNLLPADTKLPAALPEKSKRVKTEKVEKPAKKKRKPKKVQSKKRGKKKVAVKKTAKREAEKKKVVEKWRKGKSNVKKSTIRKPKAKRGRKARK